MGLRIRSVSRATPLRQSTTVPNVSKTSALTLGIGRPAPPCARARLGAKTPEQASAPVAANAAPRRMRLRRVEFIVTVLLQTQTDVRTIAPTAAKPRGIIESL